MIGLPFDDNDLNCLGWISEIVISLLDPPEKQLIDAAREFGTTKALAAWLRALPQRNDEGEAGDDWKVAECRPEQRLRILAEDPNCVERAATYLAVAELIDPRPVRRLATMDYAWGRHTYVIEEGIPVMLDPRVTEEDLARPTAPATLAPIAEPVPADTPTVEPVVAESAVAEPVVAELAVAELAISEPMSAEPVSLVPAAATPRNRPRQIIYGGTGPSQAGSMPAPIPSPSMPYGAPPASLPYGPPPLSLPYGPPLLSLPYGPPPPSLPYGPPPLSLPYGPPPYGPPSYGPPPRRLARPPIFSPPRMSPVAIDVGDAIAFTTYLGQMGAASTRNGPSRANLARNAIQDVVSHARPPSDPRTMDAINWFFSTAERVASDYGPRALRIVRTTALAVTDLIDDILAQRTSTTSARNLSFEIGGHKIGIPSWLTDAAEVGGKIGLDIGALALGPKLASLGITGDMLELIEQELNAEGLSLGPLKDRKRSFTSALSSLQKRSAA